MYFFFFFWSSSITDDDVFLFNVESGFCCGRGGQCVRSIVYHKVGIDNQNPELGRALEHADVCDYFWELQQDRIQRQSMTFQKHR